MPLPVAKVGKQLVKSPKVYVRDNGLLHALLGVADVQALQGHPVAGASWEVRRRASGGGLAYGAQLSTYRTAAGSELDLVVKSGGRRLGIEVMFSAAPKLQRGYWQWLQGLRIAQARVVAPVARAYPIAAGVDVVPVCEAAGRVRAPGEGAA